MYLGNSATTEGQVFPHGTKITYIGFTLSMIRNVYWGHYQEGQEVHMHVVPMT